MSRPALPTDGTATVAFLASERGAEALAIAAATRGIEPLARRAEVERRAKGDFAPGESRAALAQDDLRVRAAAKTPLADRLLFTRDALEQASPSEVADERAERFAAVLAAGGASVADLGAGIGLDALALAKAGLAVRAVERDPIRAACLRHNVVAAGFTDRIEVVEGDFLADMPEAGAAFLDPDRRPGGVRTRDLAAFEPPAAAWRALADRYRHLVVKLPPSLAPNAVEREFPDARLEWVSLRGEMKEARLFLGAFAEGAFAQGAPRRALMLPSRAAVEGAGAPWPEPRAPLAGDLLLDPDPAVVVAGLVGDAAGTLFVPIHPRIAYLVGSVADAGAARWADALRVDEVLHASPRALQAWLDREDVGNLTIRSRGVADPPDAWRRRLRPPRRGRRAGILVLTRTADGGPGGDRYLGLAVSSAGVVGGGASVSGARGIP